LDAGYGPLVHAEAAISCRDAASICVNNEVQIEATNKEKGEFTLRFLPLKAGQPGQHGVGFNLGKIGHPIGDPAPQGLGLKLLVTSGSPPKKPMEKKDAAKQGTGAAASPGQFRLFVLCYAIRQVSGRSRGGFFQKSGLQVRVPSVLRNGIAPRLSVAVAGRSCGPPQGPVGRS
jgi:hypothetical protein